MAAEIVDVAEAVLADLEADYESSYIIKRAWSVGSLWREWGNESEHDAERIRIFVVPVAAPRSELTRGYEQVNPEVSIAVCQKTDNLDDQDALVGIAATILLAKRRSSFTTDSGVAKVTSIDHVPASESLLEKGIMASLIRLTLRMEVAHS